METISRTVRRTFRRLSLRRQGFRLMTRSQEMSSSEQLAPSHAPSHAPQEAINTDLTPLSQPSRLLSPQSDSTGSAPVESDCQDTSPSGRSRFSLRRRPPKSEKPSYCDEIDHKSDLSDDMTPEAQEAYNILVVTGQTDAASRERDRSRSNRERRRQRSLDHQHGESSERSRNVNMNIREPQGIPFRRAAPASCDNAAEEEDTNPLRRLRASQGRIPPRTKPKPKPRPPSGEIDPQNDSHTNGSASLRNENIRKPNLISRSAFASKLGSDPPVLDSSYSSSDDVDNQNVDAPVPPRKPLRPGSISAKPRERIFPLDMSGSSSSGERMNCDSRVDNRPSSYQSSISSSPSVQSQEPNANIVTEQPAAGTFPPLVDSSQFCVKNVRCTAQQMGFEDSQDSFWSRKVNFEEFQFEGDSDVPTTIRYKTSDSVSYEDLMEFALDGPNKSGDSQICDEIRLMRRVLTKDVTIEDCMMGLEETNWEVHAAVKYLKLKQLLSTQLGSLEACKQALVHCTWSVQEAANYLIANPPGQDSPDCVNV